MVVKSGSRKIIIGAIAATIFGGVFLLLWLKGPRLTEGKGINPDKIKLLHLGKELEKFKRDCGSYPPGGFNLRLLVSREPGRCGDIPEPSLWSGQDASIDQWGNKIQLKVVDDSYILTALGKDGKPGGEGKDADWTYDSVRKEVMRSEK